MSLIFHDTKVATPPGFPTHVSQFTEEVKTVNKGNTVTWMLFPESFSNKEGKEARVAINVGLTLVSVLVKAGDGWVIEKKVKCFGRTFEWLMMQLAEQIECETA